MIKDTMITADDTITICESAQFISENEYAERCKAAGLEDCSPSAFADEYGYTAVIAVKRNGESGWACFF